MPRPPGFNIDPIFLITTPVDIIGERNSGGTGFFFNFEESTYLVTNRHVISGEDNLTEEGREEITNRPPEIAYYIRGDDDFENLNRVELDLSTGESPWCFNPHGADISVIRIPQRLPDIWDVYNGETLTYYSLALTDRELLNWMRLTNDTVYTLGYPERVFDPQTKFPIRRNALIASPFGRPFNGEKKFLIDSRMDSGTSGSPVLINPRNIEYKNREHLRRPNPVPLLIGIHSGNMLLEEFLERDDEDITRDDVLSDLNETWRTEQMMETIVELNREH